MDAPGFFLDLAAILLCGRVLAEVATRFGAPSVIGELAAGLLLGPSVLAWMEPTPIIQILAEFGIILLLFEVGLHTDVSRLVNAGPRALLVAVGGFIIPFVLGYGLTAYVFHFEPLVALFVGGTLTATSIGVTVRILQDVKRQSSYEGQVVLGAAVIDDVLGILLLAVLYDFASTGEIRPADILKLTAFIAAFFVIAPVAGALVSRVVRHLDNRSDIPGLTTTLIVSLVLLFAALAHFIGAPQLLGGFAAGLALSRRFFFPFGAGLATDPEFSHRVERRMLPIMQLFTPIFFVTVGLSLDLRHVDWGSVFIWVFSLSVAFVAIAGKIAGGFLLFKDHWLYRAAIGIAMVPRGEVGLVFSQLGLSSGILNAETYAAMVIVIAYTTLFSPFWIKIFYRLYGARIHTELEAGAKPLRGPR